MWDEVDPDTNVSISIAPAQHKTANVRELIQASSRACADLCFVSSLLLLLEALGLHQLVDLVGTVTRHVNALHLLAVLVEEDQVRVVTRNEIQLQSCICISMARSFHKRPHLR